MTTAQHHYQACVSAWANHLTTCANCQKAVKAHKPCRCETGRACLDELRIAAQRLTTQQTTPRAA